MNSIVNMILSTLKIIVCVIIGLMISNCVTLVSGQLRYRYSLEWGTHSNWDYLDDFAYAACGGMIDNKILFIVGGWVSYSNPAHIDTIGWLNISDLNNGFQWSDTTFPVAPGSMSNYAQVDNSFWMIWPTSYHGEIYRIDLDISTMNFTVHSPTINGDIPNYSNPAVVLRTIDKSLWIFGGRNYDTSVYSNITSRLDPETNTIDSNYAPIPIRVYGSAVCYSETLDSIFLFGGMVDGIAVTSVYKYDISADEWTELTPLSSARNPFRCLEFDYRTFILTSTEGYAYSVIFDPITEKYTNLPSLDLLMPCVWKLNDDNINDLVTIGGFDGTSWQRSSYVGNLSITTLTPSPTVCPTLSPTLSPTDSPILTTTAAVTSTQGLIVNSTLLPTNMPTNPPVTTTTVDPSNDVNYEMGFVNVSYSISVTICPNISMTHGTVESIRDNIDDSVIPIIPYCICITQLEDDYNFYIGSVNTFAVSTVSTNDRIFDQSFETIVAMYYNKHLKWNKNNVKQSVRECFEDDLSSIIYALLSNDYSAIQIMVDSDVTSVYIIGDSSNEKSSMDIHISIYIFSIWLAIVIIIIIVAFILLRMNDGDNTSDDTDYIKLLMYGIQVWDFGSNLVLIVSMWIELDWNTIDVTLACLAIIATVFMIVALVANLIYSNQYLPPILESDSIIYFDAFEWLMHNTVAFTATTVVSGSVASSIDLHNSHLFNAPLFGMTLTSAMVRHNFAYLRLWLTLIASNLPQIIIQIVYIAVVRVDTIVISAITSSVISIIAILLMNGGFRTQSKGFLKALLQISIVDSQKNIVKVDSGDDDDDDDAKDMNGDVSVEVAIGETVKQEIEAMEKCSGKRIGMATRLAPIISLNPSLVEVQYINTTHKGCIISIIIPNHTKIKSNVALKNQIDVAINDKRGLLLSTIGQFFVISRLHSIRLRTRKVALSHSHSQTSQTDTGRKTESHIDLAQK